MTLTFPRFTARALCAEADPEAFFPDKGGTTLPAKLVCNGDDQRRPCPARDECLAWALANREWGVWGGTSALERYWMRRRQTLPRARQTDDERRRLRREADKRRKRCPSCGRLIQAGNLSRHRRTDRCAEAAPGRRAS